MTSFNLNMPAKMPQVTEAQNMMNNGGGGNTGYFESERKKKKKKEEEIDASFLIGKGEDKFEHSEQDYEDDDDYYNASSSLNTPKEDKNTSENKNNIFDTNSMKNKFLGLIGKIVKNDTQEEISPNNDYTGYNFLTISKSKDV